MKDSRILIIGGTGFIGKKLTEILRGKGFSDVRSVSRSGHNVDVTNYETVHPHVAEADVVINMAGLVSFFKGDRERLMRVNHQGALNVLKACEECERPQRLIHVSSSAALGYGDDVIHEESEFDWGSHKFLGYSYSKHLPNRVIHQSSHPTNIIYPPLVVAPEDETNTKRLLNYLKGKKLVFAPPGMNGIIHVNDLCEAISLVLEKAEPKKNYIVNGENVSFVDLFKAIGGGQVVKIPKFLGGVLHVVARLLEKLGFNVPSESVFLGFKNREFSSDKIKNDLGFVPKHDPKNLN